MKIWVDADACPQVIKQILFKAAQRTGMELLLVANHSLQVPPNKNICSLVVEKGFDIADNHIVEHSQAGDLVITGDIPLAAELIEKKVDVINTRGEVLDKHNVRARLNIRDFMDTMRSSGVQTKGPAPLGQREKQAFANQLDAWLARNRLNSN